MVEYPEQDARNRVLGQLGVSGTCTSDLLHRFGCRVCFRSDQAVAIDKSTFICRDRTCILAIADASPSPSGLVTSRNGVLP
jgi:hypothetical protein